MVWYGMLLKFASGRMQSCGKTFSLWMVFWGSAPTKKRFGSWDRKHNIGRCYGDRLRSLNFNDWISLWFGCLCGESLSSPESQQNYSMSLTWNEHRDYFLVTCHYDMIWSGTRPAESGSGVRGAGGSSPLAGELWMGSWDPSQMVQMGYLNPSSDPALHPRWPFCHGSGPCDVPITRQPRPLPPSPKIKP